MMTWWEWAKSFRILYSSVKSKTDGCHSNHEPYKIFSHSFWEQRYQALSLHAKCHSRPARLLGNSCSPSDPSLGCRGAMGPGIRVIEYKLPENVMLCTCSETTNFLFLISQWRIKLGRGKSVLLDCYFNTQKTACVWKQLPLDERMMSALSEHR